MTVKLLTEHHLEFLSLKGGCRGSSESTLVKISNCWKSHAAAHFIFIGYLKMGGPLNLLWIRQAALIVHMSIPRGKTFTNITIFITLT